MLHQHCKNLQIFEESGLAKEKVNRIMDVLDAARNQLQASALQSHWMDPEREMIVPEEAEEIEQNLFNWEYEKLKAFQQLFKYILRQLKIAEYRKLGDKCCVQVIREGIRTFAWEVKEPILEFIYNKTRKELNYVQWKNLTSSRDIAEQMESYLIASNQLEFPEVKPNRYLWAFRNGLYNAKQDMFYDFNEKAQ